MRGFWVWLGWFWVLALAQPIDPLQRPREEAGLLRYTLGLRYTPQGFTGVGVDPERGAYALVGIAEGVEVALGVEYGLDERWAALLSVTPELRRIRSERRFAEGSEGEEVWEAGLGGGLGLQWRLAPGSSLDPRVGLELRYPWALRATLSASLLSDPVVLSASLALRDSLGSEPLGLDLALDVRFVANERISLGLSTTLGWTLDALRFPSASLGLRAVYTLEPSTEQQIAALSRLSWQGQELRWSWGLEFSGRLP